MKAAVSGEYIHCHAMNHTDYNMLQIAAEALYQHSNRSLKMNSSLYLAPSIVSRIVPLHPQSSHYSMGLISH